jgi:hypothetical protein
MACASHLNSRDCKWRDVISAGRHALVSRVWNPRLFEATGEHVAVLALGRDLNGDGLLRAQDGEVGPSFGVSDRNFLIQQANDGESASNQIKLTGCCASG